jgi:acyl carrier protein
MTAADQNLAAVRRLMQSALKLSDADAAAIDRQSTPVTVPGWTSMAHLELLLAVEREFDVTFEAEQIAAVASVAAILQALGDPQ